MTDDWFDVPQYSPEMEIFLKSNSLLFTRVHETLNNFPKMDRRSVPPIACESILLSEEPYVELNRRQIFLGSTGCIDIQNNKKLIINVPNGAYPYPYAEENTFITSPDALGQEGEIVCGEHLSITAGRKTIYTGILGILYTMINLTIKGEITDIASVRFLLEYALYNTSSTTFRGVKNYYSWVSCTNLKDVGLDYILEILYSKITQYQCEYFSVKNDTILILQHISELLK